MRRSRRMSNSFAGCSRRRLREGAPSFRTAPGAFIPAGCRRSEAGAGAAEETAQVRHRPMSAAPGLCPLNSLQGTTPPRPMMTPGMVSKGLSADGPRGTDARHRLREPVAGRVCEGRHPSPSAHPPRSRRRPAEPSAARRGAPALPALADSLGFPLVFRALAPDFPAFSRLTPADMVPPPRQAAVRADSARQAARGLWGTHAVPRGPRRAVW